MLDGKKILMIVGGGIAAYKSLELIRQFRTRGAVVKVVLTEAARRFISPLSAASLSGQKVYTELFSDSEEAEMGHIALSRSCDLVLIVPLTADLMAKIAHGHADDLASTVLLASDKPIIAAPSMNVRMWQHPATQRNLDLLRKDGVFIVDPAVGDMACGEFGSGRLADNEIIINSVVTFINGLQFSPKKALTGKSLLVTAGPTHEPIDAVRYIANRSSGKQGYAIAEAAHRAGASVTLISGPTDLNPPLGVNFIQVSTAIQMYEAVMRSLPVDIFVGSAAVADWRIKTPLDGKIQKAKVGVPQIDLIENPDILASVARHDSRPELVVGFAAETERVIEYAKNKLEAKGCDIIVANDVSDGDVMGGDENTVHIIEKEKLESWEKIAKTQVAEKLVEHFASVLSRGS